MNRIFQPVGLALCLLFALARPGQAQLPPPKPPQPFDSVPEALQKQLRQLLDDQEAMRGRFKPGNVTTLAWGDARLTPVDAKLQEQLGLPENEGMVIASIPPSSAAEKAGLKLNDVLVKINDKAVPSGIDSFVKLVKDQKPGDAIDLVVVRNGKEETLKGARMPDDARISGGGGGFKARRPLPNNAFGRIPFNVGRLPINPFLPGPVEQMRLEVTINGAKFVREQKGDQFSGEYSKDELKITMSGRFENGFPRPNEITVQEGKELKKFANPQDAPAQHRAILQQLLPSPLANMLLMPIPNLRDFPGLPVIPGIDP